MPGTRGVNHEAGVEPTLTSVTSMPWQRMRSAVSTRACPAFSAMMGMSSGPLKPA